MKCLRAPRFVQKAHRRPGGLLGIHVSGVIMLTILHWQATAREAPPLHDTPMTAGRTVVPPKHNCRSHRVGAMLASSLLAPTSREHGPDRRAPVTPITPRKVIGTTPSIETSPSEAHRCGVDGCDNIDLIRAWPATA